jgi:hypothetical protein
LLFNASIVGIACLWQGARHASWTATLISGAMAVFGLRMGWLIRQGHAMGLLGALLFYTLHSASYYTAGWTYRLLPGLSLVIVYDLPNGTLLVDFASIGLGLTAAFSLHRHLQRHPQTATAT